jgi:hypothetical protein
MSRHSEDQGQVLSVGAFVGGELYLSWMQFFPSPFIAFILSLFIVFFFLFASRSDQRTLPWRGDQS